MFHVSKKTYDIYWIERTNQKYCCDYVKLMWPMLLVQVWTWLYDCLYDCLKCEHGPNNRTQLWKKCFKF
jgi:hypothetical protein